MRLRSQRHYGSIEPSQPTVKPRRKIPTIDTKAWLYTFEEKYKHRQYDTRISIRLVEQFDKDTQTDILRKSLECLFRGRLDKSQKTKINSVVKICTSVHVSIILEDILDVIIDSEHDDIFDKLCLFSHYFIVDEESSAVYTEYVEPYLDALIQLGPKYNDVIPKNIYSDHITYPKDCVYNQIAKLFLSAGKLPAKYVKYLCVELNNINILYSVARYVSDHLYLHRYLLRPYLELYIDKASNTEDIKYFLYMSDWPYGIVWIEYFSANPDDIVYLLTIFTEYLRTNLFVIFQDVSYIIKQWISYNHHYFNILDRFEQFFRTLLLNCSDISKRVIAVKILEHLLPLDDHLTRQNPYPIDYQQYAQEYEIGINEYIRPQHQTRAVQQLRSLRQMFNSSLYDTMNSIVYKSLSVFHQKPLNKVKEEIYNSLLNTLNEIQINTIICSFL